MKGKIVVEFLSGHRLDVVLNDNYEWYCKDLEEQKMITMLFPPIKSPDGGNGAASLVKVAKYYEQITGTHVNVVFADMKPIPEGAVL